MSDIRVVAAARRHHDDWARLYADYALFYGIRQTAEMRDRVWGWLHDAEHECKGLIAEDKEGRAVGLAHYRPFARPLSATTGGYLDDLYVDSAVRGRRVGQLLLTSLAVEGRKRDWSVIRWITAEDNARARALYDRAARLTSWRTYDIIL